MKESKTHYLQIIELDQPQVCKWYRLLQRGLHWFTHILHSGYRFMCNAMNEDPSCRSTIRSEAVSCEGAMNS